LNELDDLIAILGIRREKERDFFIGI